MSAPPPVPPVADADRYVSYTPGGLATSSVAVTFPIYGDGTDLLVTADGVALSTGWSLASASGKPTSSLSQPITDGVINFLPIIAPQTITITGAIHPRQLVMPIAPGIARREFNQTVGYMLSAMREILRVANAAHGGTVGPPGPVGPQGPQGPAGAAGAAGANGAAGAAGAAGANGANGSNGITAVVTATIYANTAAGIAATTNGQYFSVISGSTILLYQNVSGVATYVLTYGSNGGVTIRQVRSWAAANSYINTIDNAVVSDIANAVNIQWNHGSTMLVSDTLYNFIQSTLGLSGGAMTAAYTAMGAYPP